MALLRVIAGASPHSSGCMWSDGVIEVSKFDSGQAGSLVAVTGLYISQPE